MPRPERKRPISITVYEGRDANDEPTGIWHGFITLGSKPNGDPKVWHRQGKDKDIVEDKIRQLEDEYAKKKKVAPVKSPKLGNYLTDWLNDGQSQIPPRWSYNGHRDYLLAITRYIVPYLGGHTLRMLETNIELTRQLIKDVARDHTDHAASKAYKTLRAALNDARRSELIDRNPLDLVKPPKPESTRAVGGLTMPEGHAIRDMLERRPRDRARFEMALILGQRQGEALGLMKHRPESPRTPTDVDLARRQITIREKLYRETYVHGCVDPHACGAAPRRHNPKGLHVPRTDTCPGIGTKHDRYHKKGCPPAGKACPPGCVEHEKACPQRRGGLKRAKPKSKSGERVMVIPEPMVASFEAWEAVQAADKELAADMWVDSGHYFTNPLGGPITPEWDYRVWCEVLIEAGVDPARLHDARHFAATYLRALGVSDSVITRILGWASESMIAVYDDVADEALYDAADRMGKLFYKVPEQKSAPEPDHATDHATGAIAEVIDLAARRRKKSA